MAFKECLGSRDPCSLHCRLDCLHLGLRPVLRASALETLSYLSCPIMTSLPFNRQGSDGTEALARTALSSKKRLSKDALRLPAFGS